MTHPLLKPKTAAPIHEEAKGRWFYHGCSLQHQADGILSIGIQPREVVMQEKAKDKHFLAPAKGRVYVTPSFEFAAIHALGGDMFGHVWYSKYNSGPNKDKNPYGYIFGMLGEDLQGDVVPDEDVVGGVLGDLYKYRNAQNSLKNLTPSHPNYTRLKSIYEREIEDGEKKPINQPDAADVRSVLLWAAEHFLTDRQKKNITSYEVAHQAAIGKKLQPKLTQATIKWFLDNGAHVAHLGAIHPSKAWRFKKVDAEKIKRAEIMTICEEISVPEMKVAAPIRKEARTFGPVYHGTPEDFDEFKLTKGKRTFFGFSEIEVQAGAFFFTEDPQKARNWADNRRTEHRAPLYVIEAYLKMANPLDLRDPNWVNADVNHPPLPYPGEYPDSLGNDGGLLEVLRDLTEGKLNEADWYEMGIDINNLRVVNDANLFLLVDTPEIVQALKFLKFDGIIMDEGEDPDLGGTSYAVFNASQIEKVKRKKVAATQTVLDDPKFKAWFAGSKIVDEGGKPLLVYHGSSEKIKDFKWGRTIHFTDSRAVATGYARGYRQVVPGYLYAAYLKIANPIDLRKPGETARIHEETGEYVDSELVLEPERLFEEFDIDETTNDGIINPHEVGGGARDGTDEYVVFNPDQVWRVEEIPVGFDRVAATTETLYHVTFMNRLNDIAEEGLVPGSRRSIGAPALDGHAAGKVFLTTADGVSFWLSRAEMFAHNDADNPVQEGFIPMVLRVRVPSKGLVIDEIGTDDAAAEAFYTSTTIDAGHIEYWGGTQWSNLPNLRVNPDEYESIYREHGGGDEEGYLNSDSPFNHPNLASGTIDKKADYNRDAWKMKRHEYGGKWDENETDEQTRTRINKTREWEQSALAALSTGELTPEEAKAQDIHPYDIQSVDNFKPLPQTLYHVTTAASKVKQEGLMSRWELSMVNGGHGLGGGSDKSVSFTTDIKIAEDIYSAMVLGQRVASGQLTVQQLYEDAKAGTGAKRPYLKEFSGGMDAIIGGYEPLNLLMRGVTRKHSMRGSAPEKDGEGWQPVEGEYHWTGGDGKERYTIWERPLTSEELHKYTWKAYQAWLYAREQAGGDENPLFFSTDIDSLGKVHPKEIAILQYRPKPGAMGTQESALGEWRTYSGKAVEFVRVVPSGTAKAASKENPILVVVHPGSACGSADFNLGRFDARAGREGLIREFDNWNGGIIILSGALDDELPSYPSLNTALNGALDRAKATGKVALRVKAHDPTQATVIKRLLKSEKNRGSEYIITGAWHYDNDGGCVGDTYKAIRSLGLKATISEMALSDDDDVEDDDEEYEEIKEAAIKKAMKITVPESEFDHFWVEPPPGHEEFWAFRWPVRAKVGDEINFMMNKKPVAKAVIWRIEKPGESECEQTGRFKSMWKVYWKPESFKKVDVVAA